MTSKHFLDYSKQLSIGFYKEPMIKHDFRVLEKIHKR